MCESGTTLGKYRLTRCLGRGGMGTVHLARDEDLCRDVAVKVIDVEKKKAENALERFRLEAQTIAQLDSPHVVRIYEFNASAKTPYLVMEYVPGQSLADMLDQVDRLPPRTVAAYAKQALNGLATAHEAGVVHRDIKPANLLISTRGVLKIADFGLARSLDVDSGLTNPGMIVGTVHYLAPEVARGGRGTMQSDLYSLGVTLYEALTGEVPIDAESPLQALSRIAREPPPPSRSRREDVPPELDAWLQKLLEHDLSCRYGSAREALDALSGTGSFESNEPAGAEAASPFEPTDLLAAPEAAGTGGRPRAEELSSRGAGPVNADEVESILHRAMALEREQRERLSEEDFMQIAVEAGVDPEAAREAFRRHPSLLASQAVRRRRALLAATAAVSVLLIAGLFYWRMRPPAQAMREVRIAGGGHQWLARRGTLGRKAPWSTVGEGWTSLELTARRPGDTIMLRVRGDGEAWLRVGEAPPLEVHGLLYAQADATGPIQVRAVPGAGSVRIAAVIAEPVRLAALPFGDPDAPASMAEMARALGDVVTTRLAAAESFQVVTRVQVDKVIENLSLEQSDYFDPSTASRVGHLLGTDYLVVGSVQQLGRQFRLAARCINPQTGEVLIQEVIDGSSDRFFELQDVLSGRIVRGIQQMDAERLLPSS